MWGSTGAAVPGRTEALEGGVGDGLDDAGPRFLRVTDCLVALLLNGYLHCSWMVIWFLCSWFAVSPTEFGSVVIAISRAMLVMSIKMNPGLTMSGWF